MRKHYRCYSWKWMNMQSTEEQNPFSFPSNATQWRPARLTTKYQVIFFSNLMASLGKSGCWSRHSHSSWTPLKETLLFLLLFSLSLSFSGAFSFTLASTAVVFILSTLIACFWKLGTVCITTTKTESDFMDAENIDEVTIMLPEDKIQVIDMVRLFPCWRKANFLSNLGISRSLFVFWPWRWGYYH